MSLKWHGEEAITKIKAGCVKGLTAAAVQVTGDASEFAPYLSGNLKTSINYTVDEEALEATVGTNVEYGPYQELGTSKIAAQPFLRPALDQNQSIIEKLIADAIKGELK